MQLLLTKYDVRERDTVQKAILAVDSEDQDAIISSLKSGSVWGGAGSLLDVSLLSLPSSSRDENNIADDVTLRVLERQLAEELERLHIASDLVVGRKLLLDKALSKRPR